MKDKTGTPDIYEDLRHRLITGQFVPGQKLKPDELRGAYNCSINTVREVLLRLSSAGLVGFQDQRGFRARDSSVRHQHELTQMRILLEQEGAVLSMRRGGLAWEARLTAAHHKLSHIESQIALSGQVEPVLDVWCAAEWEFHETLLSDCGSDLMRRTFASIYDQFRQQLVTRERNYGYFPENVAEHQRIVDAALARDEALCRQRIHEHLSRNLLPGAETDAPAARASGAAW
ncbi:GntR family transcriptional regulator [Oceaniglobus roseus]|uniref:GntR family transcriptional regulator n=1 Tax=Oceaniglobus roseus TaxID=1737570 RepID=UPI000C7E9F6D|nr:GntR family transcriptional regulator [Kandeliimicrobium roseum]